MYAYKEMERKGYLIFRKDFCLILAAVNYDYSDMTIYLMNIVELT